MNLRGDRINRITRKLSMPGEVIQIFPSSRDTQ